MVYLIKILVMEKSIYIEVSASPCFGQELNIEKSEDVTKLHNDVNTLIHLNERIKDVSVANKFLERMQQQPLDVNDAPLRSRFAPWLSDKLEAARAEMASLDDAKKKVEHEKRLKEYDVKFKELKDSLGL